MAKIKIHEINSQEKYRIVGELFDVVSGLRSKKEVVNFFVGLLTPSEALMMARRIQVARLLLKGASYESIRKELNTSFQVITKIDHWMNNKGTDYSKWIKKRIGELNNIKKEDINIDKYNYNNLSRYPQHRFLMELLGM